MPILRLNLIYLRRKLKSYFHFCEIGLDLLMHLGHFHTKIMISKAFRTIVKRSDSMSIKIMLFLGTYDQKANCDNVGILAKALMKDTKMVTKAHLRQTVFRWSTIQTLDLFG